MSSFFRKICVVLMLGIMLLLGSINQRANAQPGIQVSFQTFYDALSPHGQWIENPSYGYVWSPRVDRDFRPYYSNGNWMMTEYGNTWVSDYSWGWAPFHYGRWAFDDYNGWIWIPDNTWGPAWVSWRSGGGCYGWAPMAPGISVNVSFGPRYRVPNDWWVFIPQRHIYSRGWRGHYRGPQYNNTVINNTTIINNTYINNNNTYVIGPRRGELERVTGQRINTYNIRNTDKPGRSVARRNELSIYRPEVSGRRGDMERPQQVVRGNRDGERNSRMRQVDNNDRSNIAEGPREHRRSRESNGITNNEELNMQRNRQRAVIADRPERSNNERVRAYEPATDERSVLRDAESARAQNTERSDNRRWRSTPADGRQEPVRQQSRPVEQRLERAEQQQRIENNRQRRWQNDQQPQRVDRPQQVERGRQRMERAEPMRQQPSQQGAVRQSNERAQRQEMRTAPQQRESRGQGTNEGRRRER